jgi:hypothetical protein
LVGIMVVGGGCEMMPRDGGMVKMVEVIVVEDSLWRWLWRW